MKFDESFIDKLQDIKIEKIIFHYYQNSYLT